MEIGQKYINLINKVQDRNRWPNAGFSFLGGGFLRDADHGVQPKDIDIYMGARNEQHVDEMMVRISEEVGHTFKKLGGGIEGYGHGLIVFESETKPEDEFPLNLIWGVGRDAPGFDIGLCEIYMFGGDLTPHRTNHYKKDKENKTITVLRWEQRFEEVDNLQEFYAKGATRIAHHALRLKVKYPDYPILIGDRALPSLGMWAEEGPMSQAAVSYDVMIKENAIGNPRPVLPTQGQEPERDDLGQQDGDEDLEGIEVATAARGLPGGVDGFIEAARRAVRNRTQVQPRPARDVVFFDEAAPAPAPAPAFNWNQPPVPEWDQPQAPRNLLN